MTGCLGFAHRRLVWLSAIPYLNIRILSAALYRLPSTQFAGKALDAWAYAHGIQLDFTRPGTPTDNGYIESFNGKLRDELLNTEIFFSLKEAREKLEQHRLDYNTERPHSALGYRPPAEYAQRTVANNSTTRSIPPKITLPVA